ncbi:MAG: DUF4282 domain-containing protein [Peptococcaceae bacterium]|nr:DUF4282 domain-containing protein [Peptococcaceae bacterium]
MSDFTSFEKMFTPTIIKILLYIGFIFSVILGIVEIAAGAASGEGSLIFLGLITMILGPILTRIYCELIIVIFKIHETLKEISENLNR